MAFNRRDFLKLAGAAGAAFAANGCRGLVGGSSPGGGGQGTGQQPPPQGIAAIEHIIFTMQENRSFDHYWGRLPQYRASKGYPGTVDGLPADATNPTFDGTGTIPSHHIGTDRHEGLSPGWDESHRCWNRSDPASPTATLDGFAYTAANFSRNTTYTTMCDFEGRRAMAYYDQTDFPYYYELASQFAMSDRHFSSVMTATQPNRMYLLGGSSFGHIRPLSTGDKKISAPTIFDLLEQKGITWKVYLQDLGAPHAYSYYSLFESSSSHADKIVDGSQFFTDCANGRLPQVAMFESGVSAGLDEHPTSDVFRGCQLMQKVFGAIMKSPLWGKSATFFTYDEFGGFYDHVAPPSAVPPDDIPPMLQPGDTPGGFDRYGFRVPFAAISPFSRQHYVSHTVTDHTSILKFIETRFGLSSLTQRDASAADLTELFDFSQATFATPPPLPGDGNHVLDFCNV